ncbi:unnamed protein product [Cochlearia groenlandica]
MCDIKTTSSAVVPRVLHSSSSLAFDRVIAPSGCSASGYGFARCSGSGFARCSGSGFSRCSGSGVARCSGSGFARASGSSLISTLVLISISMSFV